MEAMSYKEEHQRFMSGHTGTSFGELVWLLSSVCISTFLRDIILIWLPFLHGGILRFVTDFIILGLCSLMLMTVLSNHIFSMFLLFTVMPSILCFTFIYKHRIKLPNTVSLSNIHLDQRKKFVTYFRSIVSLITAIAILAVDFRIFPRKLAKTEEFGFGLMDVGVGFFVVSNAIVSPEARGKASSQSKLSQMKKALVSSIPLLVLGFARLISVKSTDYQEHVTEYGVHWNFFFTLAGLKVFSTAVFCLGCSIKPGVIGLFVIIAHQFCLSNGLSDYIIHGADGHGGRTSLLDANREGIFSLPGYVALYMLAVELGRYIFLQRISLSEWIKTVVILLVSAVVMVLIMQVVHFNVQMVSRRFVNAAYAISTLSLSCITLTICLIGDIASTYCGYLYTLSSPKEKQSISSTEAVTELSKESQHDQTGDDRAAEKTKLRPLDDIRLCLLQAISYNSLLFFLLANLMTGFVNMSMSTIYADTITSVSVLTMYLFSLCSLFVILYSKGIKTKFW